MLTLEEAKKAADSLRSFEGANFTDESVQMSFCKAVRGVLDDFRKEGLVVLQGVQNRSDIALAFSGVTFDSYDSGVTMIYELLRKQ